MALVFAVLSVGLTDVSGKYPSAPTQELTQESPQEVPQIPAEVAPTAPEEPAWTTFEATAYIALCDTGCSGITFSGLDVRETATYEGLRIIAVDRRVIALGSTVEIRLSDGSTFEAIALDVGAAIKGRKIDVLMADIDDAWDFGRQAVQIRILKETVINDEDY